MARDWIEMLADLAREQDRAVLGDARFDQLVDGTLPEAERLQLEKDASKSAETRAALAACNPLDASFKERLIRKAQEDLSAPPTGERDPFERPDDLDDAQPSAQSSGRNAFRAVVPRVGVLLGTFLVAVGVAAYAAWPTADTNLSNYDLSVASDGHSGLPSSVVVVAPEGQLFLELRPQGGGRRAVAASVFLQHKDDAAGGKDFRLLIPTSTVSGDTIRIAVPNSAIVASECEHVDLLVVLTADGDAPTTAYELEKLLAQGSVRARVFRQSIRVGR